MFVCVWKGTLFADVSPLVLLCHQKYPIVWQGLLALKNDTAAVQLHFVCGNKALAHRSLPLQEGGTLLRIVQRMRLEASQLESVARRMTVRPCLVLVTSLIYIKQMVLNALAFFFPQQGDSDFCLLLALPCGRDQDDVLNQTQALKSAFINYLQAKLAAGIINIPNPGSNQVRQNVTDEMFVFVCFFCLCELCVLTSPPLPSPCSLPTCYRFSHRVNFQRAIYPSSPLTSSAGSRASHHTS